jgi:ribosome-binding factor A
LNASAGFLRNALFNRLKIRAVPNLIFVLDDSIDYGFKIEKILKEIKVPKDGE